MREMKLEARRERASERGRENGAERGPDMGSGLFVGLKTLPKPRKGRREGGGEREQLELAMGARSSYMGLIRSRRSVGQLDQGWRKNWASAPSELRRVAIRY